ncbi:MAG: DUF6635 family protein [Acetobacteraceae bacterium]
MQPPELAAGPRGLDGASRERRTEELAREAVEAGIRRYCAARRERIADFVDRHFSLRAALRLHRAAFGWDMLRAPVNLTMAAPAAALHLAASGARRVGAERVANVLGRRRLLLSTSVSDRVEWLVCTDLLELPCQAGDRVSTRDALAETILTDPLVLTALRAMLTSIGLKDDDPRRHQALERTLAEYAVTRGTAAEITTALMSLSAGALTLGKLTPGVVSFGPMLAAIVAQQAAISSFPLGAGFGTLWYGMFPVLPSTQLLFSLSGGLLAIGSVLSAFAGIVADPVQRRLGLHQRRLRRMIDAMERQMLDPAAPGYAVRDRYVARLLDVFDLVTAAYRLTR